MVRLQKTVLLASVRRFFLLVPYRGRIYRITDFGARGDKQSNDGAANQAAIDACSGAGEGTVHVPAQLAHAHAVSWPRPGAGRSAARAAAGERDMSKHCFLETNTESNIIVHDERR